MTQENVEIVRGAFAEFERGNFWVPEVFDPSVRVVWLDPIAGGETETVGLDGMARTVKEWLQSFERITTVAEQVIDAGDQVVVIAEWRGSGKASGVSTTWRYGAVWTLRDGMVISLISYTDPADALEAAGLSEQDAEELAVRDLMTPVQQCAAPDTTLEELAALLVHPGPPVPVLDGDRYIGLARAGGFIRSIANGTDPAKVSVADVLAENGARAPEVSPGTTVGDAWAALTLAGADCLLVVEDGELLGAVSRTSLETAVYEPPDRLPLPPEELMRLVVGAEIPRHKLARTFFQAGMQTATVIETVLRENHRPLEEARAVLDFGCGCGRVIRHFRHLPGQLHGCDYNDALVGWCAENLPFATFRVNGLAPGLPYEDDTFDVIYALSVFTHLPSEMQRPWLAELSRITRPGGAMLITVHGESRIRNLSTDEQKAFSRGELVVTRSDVAGTNACNAYHPREYVERLADGLELDAYLPDAMFYMDQDIVLLAK